MKQNDKTEIRLKKMNPQVINFFMYKIPDNVKNFIKYNNLFTIALFNFLFNCCFISILLLMYHKSILAMVTEQVGWFQIANILLSLWLAYYMKQLQLCEENL